jgi:hypothetical protein
MKFDKTLVSKYKFWPVQLRNGAWVWRTTVWTRKEPRLVGGAGCPDIMLCPVYYTFAEATALTLSGK